MEKTWARVLRESGARVRERVFLADAGLGGIDPSDGRHIEIVVTGLELARGVPLAVDVTLVSPLHADGTPWPNADSAAGTACRRVELVKQRRYPELVDNELLRLVTAASETGGRLNDDGLKLLDAADELRVRNEPEVLRRSARRAWRNRWLTMLSLSVQDALTATLVNDGVGLLDAASGAAPLSCDVWLDDRA